MIVIGYTIKLVKIMKPKVGDKVRINHLKGETDVYDGHIGIIRHIDSIGQLHLDNCGLAIIPEEDDYEILQD